MPRTRWNYLLDSTWNQRMGHAYCQRGMGIMGGEETQLIMMMLGGMDGM